jgi:hypothetical protein
MRIKIDTATHSLPEIERKEARKHFLKDFVCNDKVPAHVIWIYVKRIRFMKHGCTMVNAQNMLEDSVLPAKYLYGKEDVIATCRCHCSRFPKFMSYLSRTARDSIRKKDIGRLMFYASGNSFLIEKPLWGLVSKLTLDDNGMRRLHEEKELVLGDQGKNASD